MKRTIVLGTLLAFATLIFVSACARREVRTERETVLRESPPAASTAPAVPAPGVSVQQPPPPPRAEVQPPQPGPGYAWVPGYWTWSGNAWAWVPGRWERPPERTATWIPGQWVQRGDTWAWRSGHWE